MCSLNSLCEKDFNILSSLMNLFSNGFTAAYLLFSNLTICTFLVLLLSVMYIFLLFLSNIVNEVLGLFISNSEGVMWIKLYFFSNGSSFDIIKITSCYENHYANQ